MQKKTNYYSRPYNPWRQDPKFLIATTAGREGVLSKLKTSIFEQVQKATHQNWLLVGPRGIGKSHLIALLDCWIKTDEKMQKAWIPVFIPEEAAGIVTLRDFFERITRIAAFELKRRDLDEEESMFKEFLDEIHSIPEDRRALNRMVAFLSDWRVEHQHKFLILLENSDRILGKRIARNLPDQKWLRELLMNHDLLLLIASSPTYFKQINDAGNPLYELFRIETLEELTKEESLDLMIRQARANKRTDLESEFNRRPGRIEALYILTGGNPRLLIMLYSLIQECFCNIEDIELGFNNLLEELTPYFQSRLYQIKPQEEKVLVAFAEGPEMLTPAEVARKLRMQTNQVTAVLNRLLETGFIRRIEKPLNGKRGTLYRLTETIYRYWFQMNSDHGRETAETFINFIVLYYSYKEIETLYQSKMTSTEDDPKMADYASRDLTYLSIALEQAKSAELEKLQEELNKAEAEDSAERIDKIYQEMLAMSPEDHTIINKYAIFLCETGKYNDGIEYFKKGLAIAEESGDAEIKALYFNNWGNALSDLAQLKSDEDLCRESFEKYKEAIQIKAGKHEAWYNWGTALSYLAQLKSDEDLYRESFEKDK